jgi:hypothetical protein
MSSAHSCDGSMVHGRRRTSCSCRRKLTANPSGLAQTVLLPSSRPPPLTIAQRLGRLSPYIVASDEVDRIKINRSMGPLRFEEQQVAFYNGVAELSGRDASSRLVELIATESHTEVNETTSAWLPLSVWASRGFDVTRIEANCRACDKKPDEMFGMLYRVRLESESNKAERVICKRDKLASSMPAGSREPMLALKDGYASDSSTSSSSSSSRRHKKKSKKSKKDKKAKKHGKDDRKRSREGSSKDCDSLGPQPYVI